MIDTKSDAERRKKEEEKDAEGVSYTHGVTEE